MSTRAASGSSSRPPASGGRKASTSSAQDTASNKGGEADADDAGADGRAAGEDEADEEKPKIPKKRRMMGVDPDLIISEERSKRRRSPSPDGADKKVNTGESDPKDPERAKMLGMQIFQKIMNATGSEGDSMSEPFIKLPSKRALPDYYETIKHPMSLEMVQKKLDGAEYSSLKDVVADLGQIFNNAKRYNVKESLIFQYAKKLHKMARDFYDSHTNPGHAASDSEGEGEAEGSSIQRKPSRSVSNARGGTSVEVEDPADGGADDTDKKRRGNYMKEGPTVYKLVKPVLKAIKDAKARDGSGRDIAGIFEELPDRRDLPDYYTVIKNPVSLNEIEQRMLGRKYDTWEEFFGELELMCSNAMTYNEDESEVFQDAVQIKGILDVHRREIQGRIAQAAAAARPKPPMQGSTAMPARPGGPYPGMIPQVPPPQGAGSGPFRGPVTATPGNMPYNGAGGVKSAYNGIPSIPTTSSYLPALPAGVVNEEIVSMLDRYPPAEQQAWAAGLSPSAIQMYRQLLANNEAKKRLALGLPSGNAPPLRLAELPSSASPANRPSFPDRQAPPLPLIKHLDFAFSSSAEDASLRRAIRLHNFRGVVTHAVILSPETSEIEITAYLALPPSDGPSPGLGLPDMSLRLNGNIGPLPKYVYPTEDKDRPNGCKWTISLPPRPDIKLDISARRGDRPGDGANTEIYVHRQSAQVSR